MFHDEGCIAVSDSTETPSPHKHMYTRTYAHTQIQTYSSCTDVKEELIHGTAQDRCQRVLSASRKS